jgi:hypothetical protein
MSRWTLAFGAIVVIISTIVLVQLFLPSRTAGPSNRLLEQVKDQPLVDPVAAPRKRVVVKKPSAPALVSSLRGRVRSAQGPVAGAIICAALEGPASCTETDAGGNYALLDLKPGLYEASAAAPGFGLAKARFSAQGGAGRLDFVLDGDSSDVEEEETSVEAKIRGRVLAKGTGDPIANARVGARNLREQAVSNADGSFGLSNVPPGEYALYARAPGWLASDGEPVAIAAGEELRVELQAIPARNLFVQVVQLPERTVCLGATVTLLEDGTRGRVEKTDENGEAAIYGLLPKNYFVAARCDPNGLAVTEDVNLGEEDLSIAMAVPGAAARLRGRVEPPRKVLLFARFGLEDQLAINVADDGSFALSLPKRGRWSIVGLGGCEGEPPLLDVEIGAAEPDPVIVPYAAGGTLRGRVIDERGAPAGGHTVLIEPKDESVCGSTAGERTGDDGVFEVAELRPGRYRVSLARETNRGAMAILKGEGVENGELAVGSGERHQLELVVPSAEGELRGIVLDPRGFPAARAHVYASCFTEDEDAAELLLSFDDLAEGRTAITDHQGRFVIKGLSVGICGVAVKARGVGSVKKFPLRSGVEVSLRLQSFGTIEGRVVTDDKRRLPPVTLVAENEDETRRAELSDGTFSLGSLSTGVWILRAEAPNFFARKDVMLRAGETVKNVRLVLTASSADGAELFESLDGPLEGELDGDTGEE